MPRATIRTPEMVEDILTRLSSGEPLAQICRDEGYPHPTTWREWCRADEALDIAHANAREAGFDAIAEDCFAIADDSSNDFMEKKRDDGSTVEAFNAEHVQRSKLRIETRLKLLAKWDPKRYGDKVQHTGADGRGPVQVALTPSQARAKLLSHLGRLPPPQE